MVAGVLPKRGRDDWGSGRFGASRGTRVHKGVDYSCYPKTLIVSPVSGKVTKIGYPYSHDLSFRYVQVNDVANNKHRLFYVEPLVKLGDFVKMGSVIGESQDVAGKYTTRDKIMKNHVHYEIIDPKGQLINPEDF